MNLIVKYGIVILGFLIPGILVGAQEVSFTADAPGVVRVGEQFRLNFVVNAEPSSFDAPEFTGFYVISGPNRSSSRSFQIINGRSTSSVSITYTYYLQATSEGKFVIPSARVTVNKKDYVSNEVKIEVIAGSQPARQGTGNPEQTPDTEASDDLFVRLQADRKSLYLGECLIVTIKLYTRLQITGLGDSEMPDYDGFWTQDIETPSQLDLVRENVNGTIYNTGIIRKVILFPQKTGELTITPFSLETYVRQQVQRPGSIFDDFFGFSSSNVRKLLKTGPVTIEVKPLPAGAPDDFHGTVGNIRLKAEVDRQEVETNDAVNYKLSISGEGNIQLAEAPTVKFPPDFEAYDPKIQTSIKNSDAGQTGTKIFEYLLIPRHEGFYRIPPVTLSYFDPGAKAYKSLRTDEINLRVAKGEKEETAGVITGPAKEDLRIIGSDILFIKNQDFKLKKIGSGFLGSTVFFLLYGAAAILFVATLLIRRNRIRKLQNVELLKNQRASKEARKRLKEASVHLKNGDVEAFYEAVLKTLEGYLADKLSIPRSDLSRDTVREGLRKYDIPEDMITEYLDLADRCEMAKYSPEAVRGSMDELYSGTMSVISKMDRNLRK